MSFQDYGSGSSRVFTKTHSSNYSHHSHISLKTSYLPNVYQSAKHFVKHPTIKPAKHFFSGAKNQYAIENSVQRYQHYNPLSSFEKKLQKEMMRISAKYGKVDGRLQYYPNNNLDVFWKVMPDYDKYLELKKIENRYVGYNNGKSRLVAVGYVPKQNLHKLAEKLYNTDKDKRVRFCIKTKNELFEEESTI